MSIRLIVTALLGEAAGFVLMRPDDPGAALLGLALAVTITIAVVAFHQMRNDLEER